MTDLMRVAVVGVVLSLGLAESVAAAAACPSDSVQSGTVCMDKYEASVWYVPSSEKKLVTKIRDGSVILADLTSVGAVAAGVVQLGLAPGDLSFHGLCPITGNRCVDVYAVSIPGVVPAKGVTWFQAAAAARNSLKRLPTNQEWQVAALGTPDTGGADDGSTTCKTDSSGLVVTGSRNRCVSDVGAFDMVGNVWELVGDWGDLADGCQDNWVLGTDDKSCFSGPGSAFANVPGAVFRGGGANDFGQAGVFAVYAFDTPTLGTFGGFRCVR
jgi:hypothetical protein